MVADEPLARQIQERIGLSDRKHLRDHYLHPALSAGLLEMTMPDKPNSSKQRYRLYRLTSAGRLAAVGGRR